MGSVGFIKLVKCPLEKELNLLDSLMFSFSKYVYETS
jgi:hypothetical protein